MVSEKPSEAARLDAGPRWTWWLLAAWLSSAMVAIGHWQVQDVIEGAVCTSPDSAQWEMFK